MNVAEWVDTFYKQNRLNSDPGRRERIIADREQDLLNYGSARISKHDSATGEMAILYNPNYREIPVYVCWSGKKEDLVRKG